MTEPMAGGRRRIDRVLSDDYLADIGRLPLEEVRALRREAQQEEADLSYIRRLLQGRIDIIRAELARRSDLDLHQSVVELLPEILVDRPAPRPAARHLTVEPSRLGDYRRRVERLLADVELSDVSARSNVELAEAAEVLVEHEQRVSASRSAVQCVADQCSSEIARRYRDGEAVVDDLLVVDLKVDS
jgi:hypothetical protein